MCELKLVACTNRDWRQYCSHNTLAFVENTVRLFWSLELSIKCSLHYIDLIVIFQYLNNLSWVAFGVIVYMTTQSPTAGPSNIQVEMAQLLSMSVLYIVIFPSLHFNVCTFKIPGYSVTSFQGVFLLLFC